MNPSTSSVSPSGSGYIDGVLMGTKWTSYNVSYAFATSRPDYLPNSYSFQVLNSQQQAIAKQAFENFENVSGLTFTNLSSSSSRADATIQLFESNYAATAEVMDFPNGDVRGDRDADWNADIVFNQTDFNQPKAGNYSAFAFMHEIGHTLGLAHGHYNQNDFGVLPSQYDSHNYSIMTYRSYRGSDANYLYNEEGSFSTTLMASDIAAVQYLYGANYNYNNTDTTYTWSTATGAMSINGKSQGTPYDNKIFATIWDGGGNDTYDLSNYTANLSVDLAPGAYSLFSYHQAAELGKYSESDSNVRADGNIFNAYLHDSNTASLIENAVGGSGDDRIAGNIADNFLAGNAGEDNLIGDEGNDTLNGGAGADNLFGGDGVDLADYSGANTGVYARLDTGKGYSGDASGDNFYDVENMSGSRFNDTLVGNASDNTLKGGLGADYLDGGLGIDEVNYSDARSGVHVRLDTRQGYSGDAAGDRIYNTENLTGSAYNDTLVGSVWDNILTGGAGADHLDGNLGEDTASYSEATSGIYARFDTGRGYSGLAAGDTFSSIENFMGSTFNDTLVGGSSNNMFTGGSGADYMDGRAGIDTVSYLSAATGVYARFDTGLGYSGDAAGDQFYNLENMIGTAYDDTLVGGLADNVLIGGAGADYLDGSSGNDGVSYAGAASAIYARLDSGQGYTGDASGDRFYNMENLIGSDHNDTLYGDSENNVLNGGAGADYLEGQDGLDTASYEGATNSVYARLDAGLGYAGDATGDQFYNIENLTGGAYDDTLVGDNSNNILVGGAGADSLDGSGGRNTVSFENAGGGVYARLDTGRGYRGDAAGDQYSNMQVMQGSAHDDILVGNSADNTLMGGAGADYLDGSVGTDAVSYSDAAVAVYARLDTGKGYRGDAAGDRFYNMENMIGSDYDDILVGNAADNILWGGAGSDYLDGHGGNDTAIFEGAASDYTETFIRTGYTRVTHNETGDVNHVYNMESIQYEAPPASSEDAAPLNVSPSLSLQSSGELVISEAVKVNQGVGEYASASVVAQLSNGNYAVAWTLFLGVNTTETCLRIYNSDGSPVTGELKALSEFDQNFHDPQIVATENGFVIAASGDSPSSSFGPGKQVFVQRFDNTGEEVGIRETFDADYYYDVELLALDNDDFVMFLEPNKISGGEGLNVEAVTFDADSETYGSLFDVAQNTSGRQTGQTSENIVRLDDGNFVVTWSSESAPGDLSNTGVSARIFNSDGSPATDEFLVNQTEDSYQYARAVTQLSSGNILFVYTSLGHTSGYLAREFDGDGDPIGDEFTLNFADAGYSDFNDVQIIALPTGGYFLAATADSGSGLELIGRQYDNDHTGITDFFQIADTQERAQPSMSLNENGGVFVTWTESDSDHENATEVKIVELTMRPTFEFDDGDGPVQIASNIAISDVDSTHLDGAVVSITGGFSAGDTLAVTIPDGSDISANFDHSFGVLTLSGTATLAEYEDVLSSLSYENTESDPLTGERTFAITLDDGSDENNISDHMFVSVSVVDTGSGIAAYAGNVESASYALHKEVEESFEAIQASIDADEDVVDLDTVFDALGIGGPEFRADLVEIQNNGEDGSLLMVDHEATSQYTLVLSNVDLGDYNRGTLSEDALIKFGIQVGDES